MAIFEILVVVFVVYVTLLLLLEFVAWKLQPDMEDCVVLHFLKADKPDSRKLYGFDHKNKLYVSSNHWFRQWYNAVLENPTINVERDGGRESYTAISVEGDELAEISRAYKLGFIIRLMSGFAPRRFLRLDPEVPVKGDE